MVKILIIVVVSNLIAIMIYERCIRDKLFDLDIEPKTIPLTEKEAIKLLEISQREEKNANEILYDAMIKGVKDYLNNN